SRDRLFEIMQGTVTDTLIPTGIGDSLSIVAHKTGTIDSMVGDTGVVDMPTGKRYVVTALVQRPVDDGRAQELIRQACRAIHDYFRTPPTATPVAGNSAVGNSAAPEAAASPVPQSPESF
ncbi:MAG TPA: serine hydrolase, partial [Chroococcidiopsis sp.]